MSLCTLSFFLRLRLVFHSYPHFYSEEMDRLFAPGLKPWKANKVVMADVRVAHKVHTSDGTPSIELEEKADGSVEHRERASIDGV